MQLITAIRNLRGENKIEPAKLVKVVVVVKDGDELLNTQTAIIKRLARCEELVVSRDQSSKPQGGVAAVLGSWEVYLDLAGTIDVAAEKARLTKEIAETEKYLAGVAAKLANQEFVSNAPQTVVDKEREKLATAQEKVLKLRQQLSSLT